MEERNTPVLEGLPDERGPIVEYVPDHRCWSPMRWLLATGTLLGTLLPYCAWSLYRHGTPFAMPRTGEGFLLAMILVVSLFCIFFKEVPTDPDEDLSLGERWAKWKDKYFKMS